MNEDEGRIYFVQPVGGGHIKIGTTTRSWVRDRQIAAMFPYGAEVITSFPGSLVGEAFLHECFRPLATATEWFAAKPALWRFLIDVIDNGRPAYLPDESNRRGDDVLQEIVSRFGSVEQFKKRFGYSKATQIVGSTVVWARLAFFDAMDAGTLPSYIRDLHGQPVDVDSAEAA